MLLRRLSVRGVQVFWDKQRILGEACSKVTPTPFQLKPLGIPCPDNTLLHKLKLLVLSNQVILEAHNKGIPDNLVSRDSIPDNQATQDSSPDNKAAQDSGPDNRATQDSNPDNKAAQDSSPDNQVAQDSSNHRSSLVNSEVHSSNRANKEALQCSQDGMFLILNSNKVHRVVRPKSSTAAREDTHHKPVDPHRKLVLAATLLARAALLNKDNTHLGRKDSNGVLRVNKDHLSKGRLSKVRLSNNLLRKTLRIMPGHTQDWRIFRRHTCNRGLFV